MYSILRWQASSSPSSHPSMSVLVAATCYAPRHKPAWLLRDHCCVSTPPRRWTRRAAAGAKARITMLLLLAVAAAAHQQAPHSVAWRPQYCTRPSRCYTKTTPFPGTHIARRHQRLLGLLPVAPLEAAVCLSASPCQWGPSKRLMLHCLFLKARLPPRAWREAAATGCQL